MTKFRMLVLAVMFGFASLVTVPAMAEHDGGKQCSLGEKCKGDDCRMCKDSKDDCGCPIASKIMQKAKFFLKNSKEIGLSDEQVTQIKTIKMETKKASIRAEAEMKIGKMELEAKLSEPAVDVEGLNAMIDKGMAGMAAGAKASVAEYAKLKAVLNETQMAKAKEIWMRDSDDKSGK